MPSLSDILNYLKAPKPEHGPKNINPTMKAARDAAVNYGMNMSQRTGDDLIDMLKHPEQMTPMPGNLGIISPGLAARLPKIRGLIDSPSAKENFARLHEAIANTKAEMISDPKTGGVNLKLPVTRWQQPDQAGQPARSGGVFYVPKNQTNTYKKFWDPSQKSPWHNDDTQAWGGPQLVSGQTMLKNPYFSHESGGGVAVQRAGAELFGDPDWGNLQDDMWRAIGRYGDTTPENLAAFLKDYAPNVEPSPIPSRGRNENEYRKFRSRIGPWLEEAAVGNKARNAGYDSIVQYGYNPLYGTQQNKPKLGEIFDLRESNYPVQGEEGKLWPQYQQGME